MTPRININNPQSIKKGPTSYKWPRNTNKKKPTTGTGYRTIGRNSRVGKWGMEKNYIQILGAWEISQWNVLSRVISPRSAYLQRFERREKKGQGKKKFVHISGDVRWSRAGRTASRLRETRRNKGTEYTFARSVGYSLCFELLSRFTDARIYNIPLWIYAGHDKLHFSIPPHANTLFQFHQYLCFFVRFINVNIWVKPRFVERALRRLKIVDG